MTTHTVLVVDDEPASLRTIERTLAEECPVVLAGGGTQALAALAAQPVALMIVDQRMPDMAGTELLARSAVHYPDVIRVLLTGYADLETLAAAINAGHVYAYLRKPWEPRGLRLLVRRGLERHDAEADRRRLVAELERACDRLRREAEQQARLLAMAAHELGTPLHVLSNALALMPEAGVTAEALRWLETARRSADWLGRGLAQMAAAARWRRGRLPLRCRPLDLRALLERLQRAYAAIHSTRALTCCVETAAELPALTADGVWLERALSNLLSNAVRFTPDGGVITVTAACVTTGVCVTVADTGVGIDERLLPEVFEPFSAACGELSRHTSGRFEFGSRGLGLGLSITKAIIEEHGGAISVRSQPGRGTEFVITLPLSAQGVKREA